MKRLFIIFLILFASNIFAQKKAWGEITGRVLDRKKETPITYATVTLKSTDNKVINGTVTNNSGVFVLNKIPFGKYIIDIQFMGYTSITKSIELTNENRKIKLQNLVLEETNVALENVVITKEDKHITQKIDKTIINIEKDILSKGGNALQALQNVPMVDVNPQAGTISLRGNQSVRILINGKPSNMSTAQLLKQTPASLIKHIEIITTPSAKYNPEGMSGIINFILKKNTAQGLNGSVSLGVEHSKNTRPNSNLNLNYGTEKLNFYVNYNYNFGKSQVLNTLSRIDSYLVQDFDFLYDYDDYALKIGTDYYFNDQQTLSFYTYQNGSNNTLETKTTVLSPNETLYTPNLSTYKQTEQIYNLDYKHLVDENGGFIEFEANYSINKNPEESLNSLPQDIDNKIYNYSNDIVDTRKSWLLNLDFEKQIFNNIKLETGLEFRSQKVFNSIITDQKVEIGSPPTIEPKGNTTFNYDRNIYSGYINLNKEYSKFGVQMGLRLEQYEINGTFFNSEQGDEKFYTDEIFSLYPSVFVSYKLSEKEDLQLAYSRRVIRPSLTQLSPIQEYVSPLTSSTGNQNLRQQFSNSVELNYLKSFKKGSISYGMFYRKISDFIGREVKTDDYDNNRQIISYTNYDSAENYGAELSANYKYFKWWTISPRLEVYVQESLGIINSELKSVKNPLTKIAVNNNFTITKRLKAQFSASYKGRSKNVQFEVDPYTILTFGAALDVLDNQGTITFRASDLINGYNFDYISSSPFTQNGHYDLEYNTIYLGFDYTFGSSKNKNRKRKYRDAKESQGGLF